MYSYNIWIYSYEMLHNLSLKIKQCVCLVILITCLTLKKFDGVERSVGLYLVGFKTNSFETVFIHYT